MAKPVGQLTVIGPAPQRPQQRALMPGGTIGGLKVVNPRDREVEILTEETAKNQADLQKQVQEGPIKIQQKINEAAQAPLTGELAQKYNSSISIYANLQEIKDYINQSDANVFKKGFAADPIIEQLKDNVTSNLALIRSGAGVSDRERAIISSLESKFSDLYKGLLSGKTAKAVAISKLATIAAESESMARVIGKTSAFKDDVAAYRKSRKSFIGADTETPNSIEAIDAELEQINKQLGVK